MQAMHGSQYFSFWVFLIWNTAVEYFILLQLSPITIIDLVWIFFFPAFLFFTFSKTLRFFSSPQFLVWAPSLCSSTLTCLLCPEEKVTNLWNEHVQNRHPTATHSYLCKPAITRTSSTRWTSSTTGAGWRDSSRIHTWARWKEAHFLRSII